MRANLPNNLRRLANWIDRRIGVDVPAWTLPKLRALTPQYSEKQHGLYLSAVEEVLKDPKVRNVALSGSYGVGKSSVLLEVARVHGKKAIAISLSTLGLDAAVAEGSSGKAATSKTNQIQKEIVKQLLYSQDPAKMPGSRFERNTRFRWVSRAFLSLLIAVPVVVVFILTKWSDGLAKAANFHASKFGWMYLIVYAFAMIGAFVVLRLVHGRLQLNQATAGSATISLAPKSATYFDQYLDEIVYLFEIDDVDLVIFEDIDRFDDPHIFETLRSLNTLLNGAKQLDRRQIRFIYAIKDSIFDQLGLRAAKGEIDVGGATKLAKGNPEKSIADAASGELARANRTKFFDVVIPMVPFVTHLSARDLLVRRMKGTNSKLSDELVDLAGRYVADMRLIKDIRNEFIIFNDRVLTGGTLKLTQDGVFAMVLYKTLHLTDFERIRLGESHLDYLYADFRKLIAAAISDRRAGLAASDKELRAVTPTASRGETLGTTLAEEITAVERQFNTNRRQLTFNSRAINTDELKTDEFWTEFANSNQPLTITLQNGLNRTLSHGDVAAIVGDSLRPTAWVESRQRTLNAAIAKDTAATEFLSHATMALLAARDDWAAEVNGVTTNFDGLLQKHLKSELARQLVSEGFIDRNFTLYTSRYYTNRVSAEAANYIIKNVDQNEVDIYAALTNQDVAAILRERGRGVLREQAAYNVNILDYLLDEDVPGAEVLIDRLARYGERERALVLAYFQAGTARDKLAAGLTRKWPHILILLISELSLEPAERLDLIDAALMELGDDVTYEIDDQVIEYLDLSYRNLVAFTGNGDIRNSATIARFLAANGPLIPDLEPLSDEMLDAVVKAGAYEITRANLVKATGVPDPSLALDDLDASKPNVYARVIQDLPHYFDALTAEDVSISGPGEFVAILEKVLEADPASVAEVIQRAAANCTISSGLPGIATELWPLLAREGRLRMGSRNLFDYTVEFGIDENIAPWLIKATQIQLDPEEPDAHKQRIASDVVSTTTLSSTQLRAKLASSLQLESYLPVASVPVLTGRLVGDLIAEGVIEDSAASFEALEPGDVEGRAYAVSKSTEFVNFMTSNVVPVSQLGDLLQSAIVPAAVKGAIVARFDEFTAAASQSVLTIAARYVESARLSISFSNVSRLASAGVEAPLVIALLVPHLPSLSLSDLTPVLVAVGGKYPELIEANGHHPKLEDTGANRQLLERMKELGTVRTWGSEGGRLKANMARS